MASEESLDKAAESRIQMPSMADLQALSKDDRLVQAAQASEAAASASSMAQALREKASAITDPTKRAKMLQDAYDREVEAYGNSKKARILTTGTFQGGIAGLGIGAGTAAGVGTAVGTLVGGILTIPTSLVGTLVGAGVGAIHGPWITLGGGNKDDKKEEPVKVPLEAIETGAVKVDEKSGQVTVQDPEKLKVATAAAERLEKEKQRKKPRKIEVRSNKAKDQENPTQAKPSPKPGPTASTDGKVRNKPKKLEIRSNKTKQAA